MATVKKQNSNKAKQEKVQPRPASNGMEYKATIGLEVHAELKTTTKMFCNSRNDSEERRPNVNVCPICMGHPGTLPVINREAVRHVLRLGVAVGGQCADFTEFDRKNYFYPDIPKGYQISQYEHPLVKGGILAGVALTRIHLEEDTGRSTHKGTHSLIDFNRAGVPLMELVTEPVIHDASQAVAFAKELQLLLQYLSAGDANMEKGEMRVEANISVSPSDALGTKVEVKNLNSFKAVERAIEYEIERQIAILEKAEGTDKGSAEGTERSEGGEKVVQETRGWDENKGITFSQRLKEDSHDYRYFPDPDLPKLFVSQIPEFSPDILKKELPELPWQKRERLIKEFGFKEDVSNMYVSNTSLGKFFEDVVSYVKEEKAIIKLSSNYIVSDLAGMIKIEPVLALQRNISAESFAELMRMVEDGAVSSRGAKDTLKIMFQIGGNPRTIAESKNLLQKNDEATLLSAVEKVIASHVLVVSDYKKGKVEALQYLVGQAMKETRGAGNPEVLRQLFQKKLG
ncbi:MAG: Asp-tRNA(Asn)/Glu-tRNA(Gln) amidotransferase subunit GatB [Patescibacteria group bacterium]